jgi:aryl-alcohol dehydrogenase-like predicted oxidoreductase
MIPERYISGVAAGRVGLGVQSIGASMSLSITESVRIIHAALDCGLRLLDTANVYAPNERWIGHGERLVAEALHTWAGEKARVIVSTKGGNLIHTNPNEISRCGRPDELKTACDASLRALGVPCIDVYHLHAPDPDVPFVESVGALEDLRRAGKIRAIGLSNVGRRQLQEAMRITQIACVQSQLSVLARQALPLLEFCGQHDIAFLAWGPLARGLASRLGEERAGLSKVAAQRGVSAQRVALAWLLAQGEHVIPLPGATTVDQVCDNAAASELALTPRELELIDA